MMNHEGRTSECKWSESQTAKEQYKAGNIMHQTANKEHHRVHTTKAVHGAGPLSAWRAVVCSAHPVTSSVIRLWRRWLISSQAAPSRAWCGMRCFPGSDWRLGLPRQGMSSWTGGRLLASRSRPWSERARPQPSCWLLGASGSTAMRSPLTVHNSAYPASLTRLGRKPEHWATAGASGLAALLPAADTSGI